jgi:hypothetical protein
MPLNVAGTYMLRVGITTDNLHVSADALGWTVAAHLGIGRCAVYLLQLSVVNIRSESIFYCFQISPAALFELRCVRYCQRDPLRQACARHVGRARGAPLGAPGRHFGRGPGKDQRTGPVGPGPGRFCELLSPKIQHGDSDLFLLGLLSLMDVILEIPMSEILEKLPLDQETKAVLLGGASRLRPLYQLMLALESGDWQNTAGLAHSLHLGESEVAEAHWSAMQWARQINAG